MIFYILQEAAWFCADEAIQVTGGMGYMRVSMLGNVGHQRENFDINRKQPGFVLMKPLS